MEILGEEKLEKGKLKALELAEEAREAAWVLPSFVAELFLGPHPCNFETPFRCTCDCRWHRQASGVERHQSKL